MHGFGRASRQQSSIRPARSGTRTRYIHHVFISETHIDCSVVFWAFTICTRRRQASRLCSLSRFSFVHAAPMVSSWPTCIGKIKDGPFAGGELWVSGLFEGMADWLSENEFEIQVIRFEWHASNHILFEANRKHALVRPCRRTMWNGVVCGGMCYYIEVIMQFRWDFFGRSTSTNSFGKFSRLMQHPVANVFFVIHSATTIGPRSIA